MPANKGLNYSLTHSLERLLSSRPDVDLSHYLTNLRKIYEARYHSITFEKEFPNRSSSGLITIPKGITRSVIRNNSSLSDVQSSMVLSMVTDIAKADDWRELIDPDEDWLENIGKGDTLSRRRLQQLLVSNIMSVNTTTSNVIVTHFDFSINFQRVEYLGIEHAQNEGRVLRFLHESSSCEVKKIVPYCHGVVQTSGIVLTMTSRFRGQLLSDYLKVKRKSYKTWYQYSLRSQLSSILMEFKKMTPESIAQPLGDICLSDNRSTIRDSTLASCSRIIKLDGHIYTSNQFRDIVYRDVDSKKLYQALEDSFHPTHNHRISFCHGNLNPRNIYIEQNEDGSLSVTSIVNWGFGGWYPEWWEYVKSMGHHSLYPNWWKLMGFCLDPEGDYKTYHVFDCVMEKLLLENDSYFPYEQR